MAFNLGVAGLLSFKNTLAAVKAGEWAKASAGMLASKWAKQVGLRAVRLAHMMKHGDTL
jgi:lysozyme